MSSDQPQPGPGEPPDGDPFRKRPPEPEGAGPSPGGAAPEGGAPPPPGEGAYGGPDGPYPGGPYGEPYGPDPLEGMPPLANRGRRLVARIIDALLIGIPVGAIMTFIVGGWDFADPNDTGRSGVVQLVVLLAYFVYEGIMLSNSGQTVGKKLMKIRVAMLDNGAVPAGRPGWYRAAVYSLPQIVPCCGFVFWLVNVLNCTWDKPYRQCIHDKVAKTVVVEAL
ncbi:RDD family protein [Streptomyces meridianus]|uniref:RDD family protein n=1 Tax=Streptomyces meridianus TaxID=2938945 RepID=A0ABT0WZR6_9ACTN|nr:RDD family protein [Streptomyces meridianus]MCM2575814.1 RDD family protein [Streptomyces meridianus]